MHGEAHRLERPLGLAGGRAGREHVVAHHEAGARAEPGEPPELGSGAGHGPGQVGGSGGRVEAGLVDHPRTQPQQPAYGDVVSCGRQPGRGQPGDGMGRVVSAGPHRGPPRRHRHEDQRAADVAGGRGDRDRQELVSKGAKLAFPIRDGIPIMLPEEARKID